MSLVNVEIQHHDNDGVEIEGKTDVLRLERTPIRGEIVVLDDDGYYVVMGVIWKRYESGTVTVVPGESSMAEKIRRSLWFR